MKKKLLNCQLITFSLYACGLLNLAQTENHIEYDRRIDLIYLKQPKSKKLVYNYHFSN